MFWLCRARESGCEARGLSHSLRGRRSRVPTTTKKESAPAAPRPMGHRAMKVPVFVPTWSLPHRARRGGVLGSRSRFPNGSTFLSPAPKSEGDARPNLGAELPLLLGAAALALGVPFPQRVPLGFPPPRPIRLCLARPLYCPCFALSGAGLGLRCVRLR